MENIVNRLKNLIPDLEDGRQTHIEWRDCDQKYRDENPDIGDRDFHSKYVEIYNERISTIKDAINFITKTNKEE